jgi:hypothetical protein
MTSRRDLLCGTTGVVLTSLLVPRAAPCEQSRAAEIPSEELLSVRILIPVFEGAGELGARVANVLRLQISHDFQANGKFGSAVLIWNEHPLPETGYRSAVKTALDVGTFTDLVLWGQAYALSDGVVTQCYLTITPLAARRPRLRPEIWTITVGDRDGHILRVSRGLPESQFDFAPIVLPSDLVARYRSIPALGIFSDRNFSLRVGTIGPGFRAHTWERDAVYLTSGGVTGWVPLPKLSDARTEVIDFTGAVIRVMRGDWTGADRLLMRVKEIPTFLQVSLSTPFYFKASSANKWVVAGLNFLPWRAT